MGRLGLALALAAVWLSGCAGARHACDRECVSACLSDRAGLSLGPEPCDAQTILPNGASLDDGLAEEEAVLIALWNNAAFQELLAELGVARADLIQAGLLPNPEVGYFFEVPQKPFKYIFDVPLEALWLRPIRVAAAGCESARVRDRLTQAGLDLIRDVRQAYAETLLARGRLRVAEEAVGLRGQIATLAEVRRDAGDISVQEAATSRIDVLKARQDAVRATYDVALAEERLRHLLGLKADRSGLKLDEAPPPLRGDLDVESLAAEAAGTRPDALAADGAVAAAAERLRLSKLSWVRFLGILDATSGRGTGHELGPGFRVTLPVANRGQGGVARAEAECDKAARQRQTVREQIVLDVRQAHVRYVQARAEMDLLDGQVLPAVEAAIRRAESAYREGDASYLVVIETARQFLDTRLRQEQLRAELRRAWAELERSVGRRLDAPPPARVAKESTP